MAYQLLPPDAVLVMCTKCWCLVVENFVDIHDARAHSQGA